MVSSSPVHMVSTSGPNQGDRPRIIGIATACKVGGAELQLLRILQGLAARGWESHIVSLTPVECGLPVEPVKVHSLAMRPGIPDVRGLFRLRQLLRLLQPAITVSFMYHANLLTRVARLLGPSTPLVCSARNIQEANNWFSHKLRLLIYRLTDPLCDANVQNSQEGLRVYVSSRAMNRSKTFYIPNGVDTEQFAPNMRKRAETRAALGISDHFVWIAVGRLEKQKDYPVLLKAFARVVACGRTDQVLLVAGEGKLRSELEQLVRKLALGNHVRFLGLRLDVPDLLNAADGFVLCSRWEGLSNALLEALSTGLPAVATNVGGTAEVLTRCPAGIPVPPRDHTALSLAMLRLSALPPKIRREMGRAGRDHVRQHYAFSKVLDQWEALLGSCLRR